MPQWGRSGTNRFMSELSIWRIGVLVLAVAPLAYYLGAIFGEVGVFRRRRKLGAGGVIPAGSLVKPDHRVDFLAGAAVASLPGRVTFALGASVATTKSWLAKIGGYEALADLLADDYEIGNRAHKAGGKVLLSREVVWTMYPVQTRKSFWEHQVRWARTVRIVRPASFVALVVTHGLPWCVLAAVVAPSIWVGAGFLGGYLFLRLLMAWVVGVWGVGDEVLRKKLWLVPVRDAIYFAVWVAGFVLNRVTWGGGEVAIEGGGRREGGE